MKAKQFYQQLYFQVIIAIIAGILLGRYYPELGEKMKPLGDGFIKLVKMIIAPVIFITLTLGIAHMTDLKKVGRIAIKAMIYFFTFSTLALIIGLIVGNLLQPGHGLNIDPATLSGDISQYKERAHDSTLTSFIMNIIPDTLFSPLVGDNILQVLLVAILMGVALVLTKEKSKKVTDFLQDLSTPVFKIVHMLMKLAPIGAFGAMAFTIGKYGLHSVLNLIFLVATFYITSILFVVIVLGAVAWYNGFSIFKLLYYLKEELLLVLGTSSSESALPGLMEKLEKAGCSKAIVGLVVPTGYSFNLDGTNIYMTLASLFIAQALNIHLPLEKQLMLLLIAMLSSKGAAGVTGAGFVTLAATLAVVPEVPLAGMTLILGIDKFMSECRALTNVIGNSVATVVVANWEKQLDKKQLQYCLDHPQEIEKKLEV
ncbi:MULTISPECIES: dicarboxylate/amino acid:cation symporter [Chryseobacterium]|uniref:Dicarboxylate/amino acid:cation symporter n=1 Tax=Chryseobacterium rhizosphaerae TaxID=395937 RepID=A0ABX9IP49_9FLAO|nr:MULTISPECIES: dicarboxylate/amino acid:cation symporter [Chryseobacterium]MDC8100921.1 dicarboxylate/amino acid:cation symporter [Chryseobacterium rhizosphaerae]MDR6544860.1 aerobic C4-dicarboxylate transport protein [Chryseobacterium rhizosphaerae]REC77469.1 dicarboxylate/amino acid:cation symporter [Chryseobacterium rhizosphaerae]GEN65653.1 C4-dicarboxylate transport protein [Chryseobacterium rhizosphaerae]